MFFLSIEFAVCFLLFFVVYWLLRTSPKAQNTLLLVTSIGLLIYSHVFFAMYIALFTAVVYLFSIWISRSKTALRQKWAIRAGLITLVGNLFMIKYFDFFMLSMQGLLAQHGINVALPTLAILVPLGISFYTFQAISYLVNQYQTKQEAEPSSAPLSYPTLLLHLSFFITVTAGPIFRAKDAIPQLHPVAPRQMILPALAVTLILLGVIKKLWFASWLANEWADPIFSNPAQYQSLEILTGIYAYALQLFFDFSGYTDIAIGIAMLLGFQLPKNFNAPYLASNLREFWSRWHMTLSLWIRDYLYIPLGGNKQGFSRTQANLMIAMLLSGIWHGAGWNFLIWGGIHGIGLVLLNSADRYLGRDWLTERAKPLAVFLTFQYVCVGWVFFRATTLEDALAVFKGLLVNLHTPTWTLSPVLTLALFLLAWVLYPRLIQLPQKTAHGLQRLPWPLWPIPVVLVLLLAITFSPSGIPGFIYANF